MFSMPTSWWRGGRLQRVRRRRGLSQARLGRTVGVHVMTISKLERGERQPSMRLLLRLAKALRVPLTALLE
jgi:transcriptional regulator with XRE-family HTH domain